MSTVAELLKTKSAGIATITPGATVLRAACAMNERRIGSLVVTDDYLTDRVVGIITERDILMRVVAAERDPARTVVAEVMTTRVLTCLPRTEIDEVRAVMRERRIRHLPVVDEQGRLVGVVSIGDVNHAHAKVLAETVEYLETYSVRM